MKNNPKEEQLFELELQNKTTDNSSDSNENEEQKEDFDSRIQVKDSIIESNEKANNENKSFSREDDDALLNNQKYLYDPYSESNCLSRIFFYGLIKFYISVKIIN